MEEQPTEEELRIANEILDSLREDIIINPGSLRNLVGGFISLLIGAQMLSTISKGLNNN